WWTAGGSNPRPPDCEPGALPAELAAPDEESKDSRAAPGRATRPGSGPAGQVVQDVLEGVPAGALRDPLRGEHRPQGEAAAGAGPVLQEDLVPPRVEAHRVLA